MRATGILNTYIAQTGGVFDDQTTSHGPNFFLKVTGGLGRALAGDRHLHQLRPHERLVRRGCAQSFRQHRAGRRGRQQHVSRRDWRASLHPSLARGRLGLDLSLRRRRAVECARQRSHRRQRRQPADRRERRHRREQRRHRRQWDLRRRLVWQPEHGGIRDEPELLRHHLRARRHAHFQQRGERPRHERRGQQHPARWRRAQQRLQRDLRWGSGTTTDLSPRLGIVTGGTIDTRREQRDLRHAASRTRAAAPAA